MNKIYKFNNLKKKYNPGESYLSSNIELIKEKNLSPNEIKNFRQSIEECFKLKNYPKTLDFHTLDHKTIQCIYELLDSEELKSFFFELSNFTKSEISIFPNTVMRNYFPSCHLGNHEWHSDAQGMHKYPYCRKLISNKNYIFGKLSIPLQENSFSGGNIDIIPCSYSKNINEDFQITLKNLKFKRLSLIWKLSNILSSLSIYKKLSNKFFRNYYLCDFPFKIVNPKSINPPPLSIVAFGNRIFHRGTPCSPKEFSQIQKDFGVVKGNKSIPHNVNFGKKNKYILYFHFGNQLGLNSYIHQQIMESKNNSWQILDNSWRNEFNEKIYKNIFVNSERMFQNAINDNKTNIRDNLNKEKLKNYIK